MRVDDTEYMAGKALEGINAISAKITQVAPMIWEKMVFLTQMESIALLAVGGICLFIAIVCSAFFVRIKGNDYDWPIAKMIALAGMLAYVPAAALLLYPWNWVGAFAPEARLIARLLGTFTGTHS